MSDPAVIAVTDAIVDPTAMASELPRRWAGGVVTEAGVPSGSSVVALLSGPGTDVSAATLDGLPGLRVIVVTSMGWDHVDTDAARARGVVVVGVEPYCVDEVAEHTIALVLDLLRGVTRLDESVRAGSWDHAGVGRTVRGTTLGLVGLGRIGAAVAWRASALGMIVSAYDPLFEPGAAGEVHVVSSLGKLVSENDVVSLHVPLTPETKGLFGHELLGRFREGSYLVNVSRGELVTEAALGTALRNGTLAGAALDVLVHEPPRRDDPVLGFPRTVLTPHAAWYSPEAVDRLSHSAGRALARALAEIEVSL